MPRFGTGTSRRPANVSGPLPVVTAMGWSGVAAAAELLRLFTEQPRTPARADG